MKKETNLCMGCMSEKNADGSCTVCGYNDGDGFIASYLPPKTFLAGRYIVGKLFSYNGESALYMGFDAETGKKVTIREYMPDALCERRDDGEMLRVKCDKLPLYKTYLAEFIDLHTTLMKSDGIRNIQTVLDVFCENNTAYCVMDYIVGISLKTYLSSCGETLSWEQVKELFPQTLTTLGIIHGMGIIHRAVSTSTIFVTDKTELKIIGFGISASRTADSDINCEVFAGYAPPEQYSNALRNGSWTDVYGIAAVLYRCLTGITPPPAPERLENDTLAEPMMVNRAVPANVSNVIMKGLELDVEHRISTIAEFVDRLFEQPQPPEDVSAEFHVPTHYAVRTPRSSSAVSGKNGRSKAMKKKNKKKTDNGTTKAIIIASVLGVIILVFLLAIFIPAATGAGVPSETTAAEETTAASTAPITDAPEHSVTTAEPVVPSQNGDGYVVPDFTDRVFDNINSSGRYSFLKIVPVYEFNNDYETGHIFDQDIKAGTVAVSGTTITLRVSKGADKIPLPEYAGLTVEQYSATLADLGIKYEVKTMESAEVAEGYVAQCDILAGDEVNVAEGQTVVVFSAVKPKETTPPATTPAEETTAEETTDVGI